MVTARLMAAAALALCAAAFAQAPAKQRIEKAADMPRFTYRVEGPLEELVRDEAAFRRFAAELRRDNESVLASYEIADRAMQRDLMRVLSVLDFLEGRYAESNARTLQIRALEDKPSDKLISGLQIHAMATARMGPAGGDPQAYAREVQRLLREELRGLPYAVVENDIKGAKSGAELMGESLIMGNVRNRLQPVVLKAGGVLSSDLAPAIVYARYALVERLPLKAVLVETLSEYLAANKTEKPDIWKARDVALAPDEKLAPVRIAVWDSGIDTALFGKAIVADESRRPVSIAFDKYGNASRELLVPIPPELQSKLPRLKSRMKGLSDMRSNIDSPEATEVKRVLSTMPRDEYAAVIEELSLVGNYSHGTHVAGIALEGNPFARLVVSRIEFNHKLLPDPCPGEELAAKSARNFASVVDFFKANQVRVVNMSWGGSVRGLETTLELCALGGTPEERKVLARKYFDRARGALEAAMASAPGILFVTSAGNSNEDASFAEVYPASISLPNVLSVGAVDKAGDEAPFTSYGPTVKVHANGYQVESYLPGGDRVALSGTSMSAPQVTNLAAKMLAVNPSLQPPDLVRLIVATAERTADGRRVLVNPARAVAAARAK